MVAEHNETVLTGTERWANVPLENFAQPVSFLSGTESETAEILEILKNERAGLRHWPRYSHVHDPNFQANSPTDNQNLLCAIARNTPDSLWHHNPTDIPNLPIPVEGQQKLRLKQDVDDLLETAGQEDWDGEGAPALPKQTVDHAKRLVDAFPPFISHIPDPDISATPQGEIDFEWVLTKNVMLTIGVCPSGEIAFASAYNGTRLSGRGAWTGSLRTSVLACLQDLCRDHTSETHN